MGTGSATDSASGMGRFERLKADLDRYHVEGTTAMAEHSWRQPSAVYSSAEHLARELRDVFDRVPLVAGCSSEVADPGTFLSRTVVGTPLLFVRQADGGLRAFLNACRHRGVEVVPDGESGCERRFTCVYHGWSYGHDGTLVGLPGKDGFEDVVRDELALAEVHCAERHGLIFVMRRPGGAPIDLDGFLGPMEQELAAAGPGRFVAERRVDLVADANWKLLMDGFLETYHVRYLHGESLRDIVWPDRSAHHELGAHGRLAVARKTYDPDSHTGPADLLAQVSMSHRLFPNVSLTWFADHFELWQLEPDPSRPNRTLVHLTMLVPPNEVANTAKWDRNTKIGTKVITEEDFAVAASTQRTLDGGAAPEWFHYGRNEPGLQHFHRALTAALSGRDGRGEPDGQNDSNLPAEGARTCG